MLPTFGIHHHNRYNAYCLADDIMEPYRPFVDKLVVEIVDSLCSTSRDATQNNTPSIDSRGATQSRTPTCEDLELTKELKAKLLTIPVLDVQINGQRSPLMIAVGFTTASLAKCYAGEIRKIAYPEFL